MLEFKVLKKEVGTLVINFEELKTALAKELERFVGIKFDITQITDAKSNRANLNKVKKAIDDRRKELKKEILKPYELVEEQAKELIGMIDTINEEIDNQIKEFEKEMEEKKKLEIENIFNEIIKNSSLRNLITLEKLFNPRWLNTTYKLTEIESDIENKLRIIANSLSMIENFKLTPEEIEVVKAKYLIDLDIATVLANYEKEKKIKEELKKFEEEEYTEDLNLEEIEEEYNQKNPDLYQVEFKVLASKKELEKLESYLNKSEIIWEVVKK